MGQYIDVYMDYEERYQSNPGLYSIIEYIGRKESKNGNSLSRDQAYKAGKSYVNSRLKKWHKTAIDRLVKATKKAVECDYSDKQTKHIWKIHKNKAKKIFKVIHDILARYDDAEVQAVFTVICAGMFNNGAKAVGFPYYPKINSNIFLNSHDFSKEQIKSLKKCSKEILTFSEFYTA